jgi:hypothetical protein
MISMLSKRKNLSRKSSILRCSRKVLGPKNQKQKKVNIPKFKLLLKREIGEGTVEDS